MLDLPDNSFKTIYADPPWLERGGGKSKRGADRHYPLMHTSEIEAMGDEVKRISEDNAHLYLWVTNNFLPDGLRVVEAWGFRYVTVITWMKEGAFGLGQYFRGLTEHCLFGVRGSLPYKEQGITLFSAPRGRHSQKPDAMVEIIESVSYPAYLEIFARQKREGWSAWGNEI